MVLIRTRIAFVAGFLICCCLAAAGQEATGVKPVATEKPAAAAKLKISAEGTACLDCHIAATLGAEVRLPALALPDGVFLHGPNTDRGCTAEHNHSENSRSDYSDRN